MSQTQGGLIELGVTFTPIKLLIYINSSEIEIFFTKKKKNSISVDDRLMMVICDDKSHPTGVVNQIMGKLYWSVLLRII